MMKEALLFEQQDHQSVVCHLCEHHCHINNQERGYCGVRENIDGTLYALNYSLCVAASIDPIEKKPLYNYLPNTSTYSFAAEGCNMNCIWCQNYEISQSPKKDKTLRGVEITPKEHIARALFYECPSISYTYTEPTIFLEYALETMKLAKKEELKNIWVSNGFMSSQALSLITPYLDAVNIDYKGPNDQIYKKYTTGLASIVMRNMTIIKQANIHLEVTCLLIPGVNDKEEQITQMMQDIFTNLGENQIVHLSRFFGAYKMKESAPTPKDTMKKALNIAYEVGLKYVYLGNM